MVTSVHLGEYTRVFARLFLCIFYMSNQIRVSYLMIVFIPIKLGRLPNVFWLIYSLSYNPLHENIRLYPYICCARLYIIFI